MVGVQVKRYRRRSTDSVVGTTEKQKYLHMVPPSSMLFCRSLVRSLNEIVAQVLTTWIDISGGEPSIHIDEVDTAIRPTPAPQQDFEPPAEPLLAAGCPSGERQLPAINT